MALRVFLGHGASGTAASMAPFVAGLVARGIDAVAIDLPKRRAEDAVSALEAIVPAGPDVVVGGHSFGGRVASLSAAGREYGALVCFSFPLHPPGGAERTAQRTAHFERIRCPALILCGEADPFARLELLRSEIPRIPRAELVTYPKLGHTLKPVLPDVLDRVAAFLGALRA